MQVVISQGVMVTWGKHATAVSQTIGEDEAPAWPARVGVGVGRLGRGTGE